MKIDRELAKTICAAIIQHIHNLEMDPDQSSIPAIITVDVQKLHAWMLGCPRPITDVAEILDAMGYNNFCQEIVTATKSSG
jgi:hypothetical protein